MKKILAFILLLFISTSIFAGQIKEIVFLGDSLTDNGNLFAKDLGILPASPYYKGRFSNGPTWAEDVSNYYYNHYYTDSENYAIGGATAIVHNIFNDPFVSPTTITNELLLSYYTNPHTWFTDKSTVLYNLWIGANDYLYETVSDTDTLTTNVVDSIVWNINSLIGNHAKYFLIMNLPDLGKTPYARANNVMDRLHGITVMHNQKLKAAVDQLRNDHPDVKFIYVDVYSVFNEMLANLPKYNQLYNQNIQNITDSCWTGGMTLAMNKDKSAETNRLAAELKKSLANTSISKAKNFDTQDMSKMIMNSPELLEAYRTNKLLASGIQPCANANEHVFWDQIHPTASVHQILAAIVEQNLVGLDF